MQTTEVQAVEIVRSGLTDAHWLLESTVDGLGADHVHWAPPGTANTIGATYAHVIGSEDAFIHGTLLRQRRLADGEWAGRNGISLPIPQTGSDWFAWSRRVQIDLPAARRYAAAVYAATDAYLGSITSDQLARSPDVPMPGSQTLHWLIHNLLTLHAGIHTGEIAVLKGLQGLAGYP